MQESQRHEIEAACYRLVTSYCHFVDHGEASKVADLFVESGIWASPEVTMNGIEEIRMAFQARQDNKMRMSRHVCNNFLLSEVGEDSARGAVYLTLYRHDGDEDRRVSPLLGPVIVGEYQDEFVRTEAGWRFKTRRVKVDFVRRED